MNTIKFYCGNYPDFVLRGSDDGRSDWIDKNRYSNLTEHIISRKTIPFSATEVRKLLSDWCQYQLDDDYIRLREMISEKYSKEKLTEYGEIIINSNRDKNVDLNGVINKVATEIDKNSSSVLYRFKCNCCGKKFVTTDPKMDICMSCSSELF